MKVKVTARFEQSAALWSDALSIIILLGDFEKRINKKRPVNLIFLHHDITISTNVEKDSLRAYWSISNNYNLLNQSLIQTNK